MSDGHGLSESELAMLTDEERAGLESGEFDDEEGDDSAGAGDDGDDDGNDGNGDDGDDGDDDAGSDGKAGAGDDDSATQGDNGASDAGAAGDDDDDDDEAGTQPGRAAERIDPAATQTRIDAIGAEQQDLAEKLDDGEITTKEFLEANKKLEAEQHKLTGALERQTSADEAVTEKWYADVGKFLERNPELNANQTRLQSFDAVVRRVTGDPENATLSNRKQLEKARDLWREEMGIPAQGKAETGGKTEGKADGKAGKTGKTPKPKPRTEIPPTLHNTPAAEMSDSDDSKFAHLEALLNAGKTIEFEAALGKLSEADQQDYLSRP